MPPALRAALGISVGAILFDAVDAEAQSRRNRFRIDGELRDERDRTSTSALRQALTGFDNLTNGYTAQGPDFETITEDNVVPLRSHNDNRFIFEEVESIGDGLGPTYNGTSCVECHQNVVAGGASQVAEHRTGRLSAGTFFDSLGGTLIQSRATHPAIVERVAFEDGVRTFRNSTNPLGAGYVEAIADQTLLAIRDRQPSSLRGTALMTPVLEAGGQPRIGRLAWKSQHASLESFAADAYLNEMGITSPLLPEENTSLDRFVGYGSGFDPVPEPEDDGVDIVVFADFMRATKAPSRGPITSEVTAGEQIFVAIGCESCHVRSIATAPAGTRINGGRFVVPSALGDKVIHPYSDFLLHDVDTGDGIPVQSTPEFAGTANKIRTAPLWGLRTRNRLMHDGLSFTKQEAIERHGGQGSGARSRYRELRSSDRALLLTFLDSL